MSERIRVITVRSLIREVAAAWADSYGDTQDPHYKFNPVEVHRQLEALDIETATADDVERIIGNRSWTWLICDVCREDKQAIVQLGDEPDYESATLDVCADCLSRALTALKCAQEAA